MSYRNPKAAPINDDSAIYEGIQKLSSDVVTFANNERARKAALITEGLDASQAVDDNVNKMGLNLKEGSSNFQTQVFEKSKGIKNAISGQFAILNQTFSSPEDRAKAKAEIARLQKYPEQLVGEMATGKYIVDQLSESMQLKAGTTGSVSFSNDINLMGVGMDLQQGGENTKIEDVDGGRVLVTTNDKGETFRLNISNITQSLAANPDQSLFKTVQDDTAEIDMYSTALGFGKDVTKETLIANNHLILTGTEMIAGVETATYGVNMDALENAAKDLGKDLLDNNANYGYASSIWQDRLGKSTTLKEAIKATSKEEVLGKIQDHYIKEALKKAQLNLGFTLKQAKLKDESQTYFASSNALDQLVKGKIDGGLDLVEFNGMKFVRKGASKKDFMISKQTVVLGDYITEIKNGQEVIKTDKHGTKVREMPSLTDDLKTQIKMYLYNAKTKQYTLNEKAWRALAGDSVIRKVPK
jgi:hypothetical protein